MWFATATGDRTRRALLALRDAPETDAGLQARTLGSLYLAGALIGLVSVLLPHSDRAHDVGLYSNIGFAFIGGLGLLTFSARVPRWMIHAVLVLGSLVIARAIILSGDSVSFYSVWFIWVGLFAFYFFSRPAAAAHVAFAALLYALTLVRDTPSSPMARWLTTVATLVVAGVLIDTLVRRSRLQASSAAASAQSMGRVIAVAHELAGLSDSAAARPALCSAAARVTEAAAAVLWEPGADGRRLVASAAAGDEPACREIPFTGPPAGAPQAFTTARTISSRARLFKPIMREDRPIGVLELGWAEPAVIDRSRLALADLLAVEVAVTLERVSLLAELEKIARTDELTGLPNRRAWQEELPRELARARRSTQPLCVAMLDLDHFKHYNDRRGHQTGDRLLKQVAGAWNSELRPTDLLARYGGEEFALALPACGAGEALAAVERMRMVMPDEQTCSAGIACWDGRETAAELLGRADQALYEAKRGGRNRSAMGAAPVPAPVVH